MPSLGFKDIAVAFAMKKNCLLIPMLPSSFGDEKRQMEAMDIKLLEGDKREEYKKSSERLERLSNILFVHLRSNAYIGRAWQFLIIYSNMKF